MCAINGCNFENKELVLQMNRATAHRGPDGGGVFVSSGVTLGHNRLSILDLSSVASQPMHNNDGTLTIVFNGEIYNFNELKKELEETYQFKTHGDTEVILAAYEKWGYECVKKMNGMFAFAVWDHKKKELFLARDHVGIKPLYYFHSGKEFVFSSEIKGILEHEKIDRTLNRDAFNYYMRVLYVPEPLTMFQGIYKFPQGSFGILKDGKLSIQKYWDPKPGTHISGSKKEIQSDLKNMIHTSVERQLISDKPVGVYLSGGIDSSIVLHNVMNIIGRADTFSVGFDLSTEEEQEKFNKDATLAKKTASFYGASHHEVFLSVEDVVKNFNRAVYHLDEPVSNPTSIAQMVLGGFSKNYVDVVLGGDGGDELFGGYERYRLSLIASYYQKFPAWGREVLSRASKKFKKLNTPSGVERFALFMFQKDEILKRVLQEKVSQEETKDFFQNTYFFDRAASFEDVFMDVDRRTWLVDESLMRSDKMAMASGLEQRVPLLDKDIVEFSLTIPLEYKVGLFDTKKILKDTFRKDLPEFLFKEPKRGWFSPAAKWLRHDGLYALASECLSQDYYLETKNLFQWNNVRKILEDHKNKKEYNLTILWAVLSFQMWAKTYKVKI